MSVDGQLVTLMTHPEIVSLIRAGAAELRLGVERGDHLVPNIKEAFPVTAEMELEQVQDTSVHCHSKALVVEQMTEADRSAYYEEAMRAGLNSRLQVAHFTTVGKMRVGTVTSPAEVMCQYHSLPAAR